MDQYCYFHPSSIAKWQCTQCGRFYDNACLPKTNEKHATTNCPNCQSRLKYLAVEKENETAFSFSLLSIIQECLNPIHALLLFSSLSAGLVLSLTEFSRPYQLLILSGLIFLMCLHFSRAHAYVLHNQNLLVHRVKRKNSRLKSLPDQLSFSISTQLTLLSLFWLLVPVYCFYSLHWFSGILLITLSSISFPFLLMFSLHSSDDNCSLTVLFRQIKPWYAALCGLSLGLETLFLLGYELTQLYLPSLFALPLLAFLLMSSLSMLINLSARTFFYGVRQSHGLKHPMPDQKNLPSIYDREKISSFNIDLDHALKTGNYPKVISLLEESLKRNGNSMLRREQLFLMLMELKDFEKLQRFSTLFLYWMMERNKVKDASRFIYLLRKQDPSFLLNDLELMTLLAKHFLRTKRFALVLWLSEDTTKRFKPSEALSSLQISRAQALITHYKDLAQAEEVLLYVFNQCSQFQSADAAKALLLHIKNHIKNQRDLKP